MIKLAVWYHGRISGGDFPEHPDAKVGPQWGRSLFVEQMQFMMAGRLYEHAQEIHIGLNGGKEDQEFVSEGIALKKFQFHFHGEKARSLIPTMRLLQKWLPGHEDWLVCFFHAKGATHAHDPLTTNWRNCMMEHVIWNWQQCVKDLESGDYDAVGVHWTENSPNDPNRARWG
jgi:hypothetical protein